MDQFPDDFKLSDVIQQRWFFVLDGEEFASLTDTYLGKKILFTDKVTSIKAIGNTNKHKYYNLAGLLYSSLFSYYILIKSSTVGIMIEQQVNDKEKWSFPYIDDIEIENIVKQIEEITRQLYEEKQKLLTPIQKIEDEKKKLITNLNNEILNSFDLDEQEKTLVDYAVDITIPLIMKHKGYEKELFQPLKIKHPFLKKYAEVFLNRFQNSFERNDKKFTIQILCSNYIIGMFFRITKANGKEQITWEKISENNFLLKLSSFGYQNITDSLFIQKDIRGFEKDGFYIVKPNEKKLWHKAVAYLDVNEFMDAMLREGSKEKQSD